MSEKPLAARVGIMVVSDRCAKGEREDATGPMIRRWILQQGWQVAREALAPDEEARIRDALLRMADDGLDLILTTGGTGFGPRDVTPEATQAVIERSAPGIAEMLRSRTAAKNSRAWLSRAVAGIRGESLIINLPGSPSGVDECLQALHPVLSHALGILRGGDHAHPARPARCAPRHSGAPSTA